MDGGSQSIALIAAAGSLGFWVMELLQITPHTMIVGRDLDSHLHRALRHLAMFSICSFAMKVNAIEILRILLLYT